MGCFFGRKAESGVTLIEVLTVLIILAVLAAAAVPAFSVWLPNYRLKNAARDLYSNLQLAKMGAVNKNRDWAVIFDDTVSPGKYAIASGRGENDTWDGPAGDDPIEKIVHLAEYKGVRYGHGDAGEAVGGGALGSVITYNDDAAVFNSRGTCSAGYVYLQNDRNTAYAVGTRSSGVILLRKWTGSEWQ
jgi:prepilin-type N-terminal cleavage/methylation domain-containing protein